MYGHPLLPPMSLSAPHMRSWHRLSHSLSYREVMASILVSLERLRLMFLCKVALGKQMRTAAERLDEAVVSSNLAARAQGGEYDSVLGLTRQDVGMLNYEENVVYSDAAAIPSYLIVYSLP